MSWLSSVSSGLGFFGMWTFGRSNKQTGPPSKKVPYVPDLRTLELTGDLIGHSGAVQVWFHECTNYFNMLSQQCFNNPVLLFSQMFVSFGESGLVTCSTDHLLIVWKNGERQSHLRSLALFQKLEENGGLWADIFNPLVAALKKERCRAVSWLIYCNDCLPLHQKQYLTCKVKYLISETKSLHILFPALEYDADLKSHILWSVWD